MVPLWGSHVDRQVSEQQGRERCAQLHFVCTLVVGIRHGRWHAGGIDILDARFDAQRPAIDDAAFENVARKCSRYRLAVDGLCGKHLLHGAESMQNEVV